MEDGGSSGGDTGRMGDGLVVNLMFVQSSQELRVTSIFQGE